MINIDRPGPARDLGRLHRLRRLRLGRSAVPTATVLAVVGVLALAGCGPTSSAAQAGAGTAAGGSAGSGPVGGGQARTPGVSGLIAEVDGKTLQVQGTNEQTAVTFTTKTTFSEEVTATAATVVKGVCVTVRATSTGAGATTGAQPTSTPVTATSVSVSRAVKGACVDGYEFGGGGFAGRHGGGQPSGAQPSGAQPSGAQPSGAPGGGVGRQYGRPVTGLVIATDGSNFTVAETVGKPRGAGSATPTATNVQVATTAATTYTERKTVTSAAARVGRCARAIGTTDGTGAMTARTIALSSPVDGVCTQVFGTRPSGSRTGG